MIFEWTKDEAIILPIMFVLMVGITIFLSIILKNKSDKIKNIPLLIITIIMLVLEVIKQILSIINGYSLWVVPLHFCSFFMVWYSLSQFLKNKYRDFFKGISFIWGFFLFIAFYIYPSSIIGNSTSNIFESFFSFHTFIYHHLAIMYFLLSIGLKTYRPKYSDSIKITICLICYAIIAIPLAFILDVNFCNILSSNIPFMEKIRINNGQFLYDFILIIIGLVGCNIISLLYTILYNKIKNCKSNKKNIIVKINTKKYRLKIVKSKKFFI